MSSGEITLDPAAPYHRAARCGLVLAALAALALLGASRASADPTNVAIDPTSMGAPDINPSERNDEGFQRGAGSDFTPLFVPVPFKNTQLGWGLALAAGAIHRFDADTTVKPSTGVVGGFYTENKSWGVVVAELARLAHDRWRVRGAWSHAVVNYDFYGIGEDAGDAGHALGIGQTMDFAVGMGLRRITGGFYAGPMFLWLSTTAEPQQALPPELPDLSGDFSRTTLVAPGLMTEFDTRDDDFWPTAGHLAKLRGWFYSGALGSSRDFQRYSAFWSWYTRLDERRFVLATNLNATGVAGDAPFYALPSIGFGEGALRGYTQGRYRDRVMVTAQAEVRYHASGRLGATVFGGFGQVAPDLGDLGSAEVLPAGGLGLRWQLTREYPMHVRFDFAWGKNEELFYFSVAEAF